MSVKPSAAEIEAYYLSDDSLEPQKFSEVEAYVKEHFLDGGTRDKFLAQRKRIEKEIRASLD